MKSVFWRGAALLLVGILVIPAMNTDAHAIGTLSEAGRAATGGTNMNNTTARNFDLFPHLNLGGDSWVEIVTHRYDNFGNEFGNSDMGRLAWAWNDWILMCSLGNPANGARMYNAAAGGSALQPASGAQLFKGLRSANTSDVPDNDEDDDDNFDKVSNPSGEEPFANGEFFTAGIAMPMGEGGVAFGLGVYMESNTSENVDGEKDDQTAAGYSLNASWGNGDNMNAAAEFTIYNGKDEDGQNFDPALTTEMSGIHFALYGEYDVNDQSRLMGGLAFGSADSDDPNDTAGDAPTLKDEQSNFDILLGAGRTLAESDDQVVTAEVFILFGSATEKGTAGNDADDETPLENKTGVITVPGCRVTASHQVSDHYSLHAGMIGNWTATGKEITASNGETVKSGNASSGLDWFMGLTGTYGVLAIDVFLNTANLGNLLSLGNTTALVGGLSATATF